MKQNLLILFSFVLFQILFIVYLTSEPKVITKTYYITLPEPKIIFHQGYLSHIILSFAQSQLSRVISNMNSWNHFPPCTNNKVKLIFYAIYDSPDQFKEKERIEKELIDNFNNLTRKVTQCFTTQETYHLKLYEIMNREYERILGARITFEAILNKTGIHNASHVLQMEPDLRPIRSNWVDALYQNVISPNHEFWIKGSNYKGGEPKGWRPLPIAIKEYPPLGHHINGNAIYNLCDEFKDFYFKVLRNYISKKHPNQQSGSLYAYDTDFHEYMLDYDHWPVSKHIIQKFVYSDVILNIYWEMFELYQRYPNAYMAHAKDDSFNEFYKKLNISL